VVRAEHSEVALQGVLAQGAGWLRLAQLSESLGDGARWPQGDQAFRAQHPAAALQGVLAQGADPLRLAHRDVGKGEVARRGQGVGTIGAEDRPPAVEQLFADGSAPCGPPFRLVAQIEGTEDVLALPAAGGGTVAVHPVLFNQVLDLEDAAGWQIRQEDDALQVLVAVPATMLIRPEWSRT
jgi:hypothetical protein